MAKLRVCFEIKDAAVDEYGNPAPAGMSVTLGETEKEIDYTQLTKGINKEAFLKAFGLEEIDPNAMRLITPEEYDKTYGGEENMAKEYSGIEGLQPEETDALKKELSKIDGWLGVPQYTQAEQADILSAAAASIERREKAQANGQELPDAPDVWDIVLSEARDASMERLNDTVHTLFEIKDCKTPEELREKLKLNEQETASLTSLLQKGGELEETLKHVGDWLHYDNPGEFFEKADNSPLTLREQLGLDEREMNEFLVLTKTREEGNKERENDRPSGLQERIESAKGKAMERSGNVQRAPGRAMEPTI